MIHIIHGDDIAASRKRLTEIVETSKSTIYLDAEKAKSYEISQAFSSADMFFDAKCIVIEKVLKLSKEDLAHVVLEGNSKDFHNHIILWHNTELSKLFLGKFQNAQVESFMLPKLFFAFLDNLKPGSLNIELDTLLRMRNVEAEQVFYAMVKRIRLLLSVKSNLENEELQKMSPWQRSRLHDQGKNWTHANLTELYEKLYLTEVKMKSGGLMLPLRKHLDILLIQELN